MGKGNSCVAIIGSDIGDLEVDDLEEAFRKLSRGYFVLGPAMDGGFYLLGLPVPTDLPFCFDSWGSSSV